MNDRPPTIAYLMSRFPKLTETFVLYEMLELRRLGFRVIVIPLRLVKEGAFHPEVREMEGDIFSAPLFVWRTIAINLKWMVGHPLRYFGTALRAAAGTFGNLKFFAGAMIYFPKAVVFADTAQRLGVSHVHAHFASHPAMAAWIMKQLCGVSYSFTAHGSDLHVCQRMLKEKAADAALAVTISDYNVRFIAEHCGEETAEKFEVIRCGTDLSVFVPRPPPKASSALFKILCVASFRPCKGHKMLLDSCVKLRERGIDFHCQLVGYGRLEREIVRQIKERNLEKSVFVAGPKSRPEVVEMLGDADVLTLASIQTPRGSREGIPIVLMEAMACGLPVVASRISGIPELVEENVSGLLFTPGNAGEAADALEKLAHDPELRNRIGKNARRRVEEAFDLAENAHQLAERIQSEIQNLREIHSV